MEEFTKIFTNNLNNMLLGFIAGIVVAIGSVRNKPLWAKIFLAFLVGVLLVLILSLSQYLDFFFPF